MHFIIDKTQENYIRKIRLYKNLSSYFDILCKFIRDSSPYSKV